MTTAAALPRTLIAQITGNNPRAISAFELLTQTVDTTSATTEQQVADTQALQDATFLTLSANVTLTGERILTKGTGVAFENDGTRLTVRVDETVPLVEGGQPVRFITTALTSLFLPPTGTLATLSNPETLTNKTLASPKVEGLGDYADDAAAGAGGVAVNGLYRTGSAVKVRIA